MTIKVKRPPSVFIRRINVFHPICAIMFGKNHKAGHRIALGFVVAGLGVVIAKYTGESSYTIVHYAGDGIGYGIHAIGLTPLIETIAKAFEDVV